MKKIKYEFNERSYESLEEIKKNNPDMEFEEIFKRNPKTGEARILVLEKKQV